MAWWATIGAAAQRALAKGIDVVVATLSSVRLGRSQPIDEIQRRVPEIPLDAAQKIADLVEQERRAAEVFDATKPEPMWDVSDVPVNGPAAERFEQGDRVVFTVDVPITLPGDGGIIIRTIQVAGPYGLGHDEIEELARAEAQRRASDSPGGFVDGANPDEILIGGVETVSIFRTF